MSKTNFQKVEGAVWCTKRCFNKYFSGSIIQGPDKENLCNHPDVPTRVGINGFNVPVNALPACGYAVRKNTDTGKIIR